MFARANAFSATEEGRAYHRSRHIYVLRFNPDGALTVPDVLPGTYRLRISVTSSNKVQSGVSFHSPIATADQEITVPALAEGEAEVPVDIGTIELKPVSKTDTASAVR